MFCESCGASVSDTAKFCSGCGNSIAKVQHPDNASTHSDQWISCVKCGLRLKHDSSSCIRCNEPVKQPLATLSIKAKPPLSSKRVWQFIILIVIILFAFYRAFYSIFHDTIGKSVSNSANAALFAVEVNGNWGYINKSGKLVIPAQYDDYAGNFHEGLALVKVSYGNWSYINKSGKFVIPAQVEVNGKYGYINRSGKFVIPAQYDLAHNFHEGLAPVEVNNKWGYINRSGKLVIPAQYDFAGNFHEGLAWVEVNYKWGYINTSGKWVWKPTK